MTEATLPLAFDESERRLGFMATTFAYTFWGFLPLYLHLLTFADVREVLGQRVLWCVPAATIAVFAMLGWKIGWSEIGKALKPRMLATLAASACFIFVNWGLYVWLVMTQRVIESSLAYFLTPLVAVAVGVLAYKERVTSAQLAALVLAGVGIIVQAFALGAPPWMALALCGTWSMYIVIRKQAPVPAAVGLLIETLVLAPIAAGFLWWASQSTPLAFGSSASHSLLLLLAGPATAIPLTAFAYGARRVSFTTLGLLQFLAPTLQFATGIAFGEPFTALRAASFALIWIGLACFSWDTIRRARMA
ncbi:MAG: EamA family transporter RarD [Proteobacteria bacterium]|nr:EamA family transporter RarD [Pseudomonadota bacterium]